MNKILLSILSDLDLVLDRKKDNPSSLKLVYDDLKEMEELISSSDD